MNKSLIIFGIVNITSDSFSDGGRYLAPDAAIAQARKLMAEGADVIDLGPASSNPDAAPVSSDTEIARIAPVLDALKADGIPVSLDSYQPATQAYALSRGVAYLNDIRGFPDAAFYPQLAKSSAKLVVMHSVQDGQADRREAPAGDIMDHIAAFFDARIAALTGAGIKRNRLVLDPGMGFFLGAAPETSLSVLARFDELRLRFDLPVLLSVSRKSFLRALTGRGPGDVGAATLAAELAAAAGGADFIRTHEPRPLRDGLAVLAALKETARIRYLHIRDISLYSRFIRKLKEPPLNRTNIFFGESHSDWLPVRGGESGDFVFRRGDGHAFAKIAPASRRGELAGERDRLIWLKGRGVACPEVINWQEEQEGACLVITAIPGVPAADLSGADLLKAWPSMGQQLGAVHSLSVDQCPFERRLSRMFGRAVDVVSRNAVNPDFLPDEDKSTPQLDLLARVERELPVRLDQERTDMVVCHGDPCMPNFMVDPKTLQCTGLIDLGRLGTADRYADLALMIANAEENWAAPDEAERAFAVLFNVLGIEAPDRERLAFYLRLDPLTWG